MWLKAFTTAAELSLDPRLSSIPSSISSMLPRGCRG